MLNSNEIASLADLYIGLKYEQKQISDRIAAVKDDIIDTGLTELVGDVAIVSVSERAGAESFDKKATRVLLRKLGATDEQIASVMKVGEASTVLNIKANLAMAAA